MSARPRAARFCALEAFTLPAAWLGVEDAQSCKASRDANREANKKQNGERQISRLIKQRRVIGRVIVCNDEPWARCQGPNNPKIRFL